MHLLTLVEYDGLLADRAPAWFLAEFLQIAVDDGKVLWNKGVVDHRGRARDQATKVIKALVGTKHHVEAAWAEDRIIKSARAHDPNDDTNKILRT